MPLFNLTDITFKPPDSAIGPLAKLTEDNQYTARTYRYPSDLGSSDKGHYMVININEQTKTQSAGPLAQDANPAVIQNRINNSALQPNVVGVGELFKSGLASDGGIKLENIVTSGFNKGLESLGGLGPRGKLAEAGIRAGTNEGVNIISNAFNVNFTRTIRRIKSTIALYMPDTLNFQENQQFNEFNLGGGLGAGILSGASSLNDTKKNNPGANQEDLAYMYGKNLAPFFASAALNSLGDIGKTLFAAGSGTVVNPMMELLYSSPSFRTFRFDFQFYPRDEKESKEVQDIIDMIRFFQAPEIKAESGGFFLIPPAEFDISFYYNGKINPNIPPISTCVLTGVDLDYAPNGFSAYEVPGQNPSLGGTGMPVSIRLGLQFKETEMVYKNSNLLRTPRDAKIDKRESFNNFNNRGFSDLF